MKALVLLFVVGIFVGCATHDARYNDVRDAYIETREVVKVIPKDQATEESLSIIDLIAQTYDAVRGLVRGDNNVTDPQKQ